MSKITVALVTTSQPLPAGLASAGTRRFTIVNPADGSTVATQDSAEVSVSFSTIPEIALVAQVQTIATDGTLFPDAITQTFSGVPPVVTPPVPSTYDAPAALSVLVEAE